MLNPQALKPEPDLETYVAAQHPQVDERQRARHPELQQRSARLSVANRVRLRPGGEFWRLQSIPVMCIFGAAPKAFGAERVGRSGPREAFGAGGNFQAQGSRRRA